jgi:hypothetical protein
VVYAKALGHKLNMEKTFISLSGNTNIEVSNHILSLVRVQSTSSYEKYLGLPTVVGKSKRSTNVLSIKDSIWKVLMDEKKNLCPRHGRRFFSVLSSRLFLDIA